MKCSHCQSILSDYLDGELSPVQASHVRHHLEDCDVCAPRWRALRQTVRLVGHLGHERCPVDLRAGVTMAVQSRYAGRQFRFPVLPTAAVTGAALTGLAIGLAFLRVGAAVPDMEASLPPAQSMVAEAPVHDQFDLATGLGSVDGLLLSLPTERRTSPPGAGESLRPHSEPTN